MDAPAAVCETVDFSRLGTAEAQARTRAAWARRAEIVHFRMGNDLLAFPAAYLLIAADPSQFGCVSTVRKIEFAVWASDMTPADRQMFWEPALEAAQIAPSRPPDDFIIKVVAFYRSDHAEWTHMGKRLAALRQSGPSRGNLYGLEDFSRPNVQYLARISEDRGVLIRALADPLPPNPIAEANFQNEQWYARALVPLRAVPRWEFVYDRIAAFVVKYSVKNYFRM